MDSMKYVLMAILVRLLYSGMEIISKAALNEGINAHVFVFYRQAFATIFMLPIAFATEWHRIPPLPFKLGFKIFMHAFVGITVTLTLNTLAFDYTTAYTASAANNSMPVCTFIVALIYGVESVKWKRSSGIAKLAGVGLFVVGTATIALYKGPHLNPLNHHHPLGDEGSHPKSGSHSNHPALGALLVIASNTCWALWMVTQGRLLKEYPSKLLFTALQCLFSAISSFLLAVPFERDFSHWKLGFNLSLISVLYCGIVITGFSFYLQSWLIEKRGPVFLALFTPLTLLVTLICSSFLLGEAINFGSLLGGVFMVGGLYSVLWGKRKEHKDNQLPTVQVAIECSEERGVVSKLSTNQEGHVVLEEKELVSQLSTRAQEGKVGSEQIDMVEKSSTQASEDKLGQEEKETVGKLTTKTLDGN